ncbi:hypothetical protein QJS10_CPA01g01170 [Acorus calamus]|uniref:Uncharacterized protein n=1 Tax=Acorus calamus TaxID=4465 RepID=A0AAV9FFT1_ACOCL|nr:hypothetical protein QJS10_CPA01g01170 [Acorus calamus]
MNVFAALETLRRKKKSDGSSKKGSSRSGGGSQVKEPELKTFWGLTPLTTTKWVDVDDDDDDFYAMTVPPPVWGKAGADEWGEEDVHDMVKEVIVGI